jgi:hypothetical protein
LFVLLKGLVVDQSLPGRAIVPDPELHQVSAQEGFDNNHVLLGAKEIVHAVRIALDSDPDCEMLAPIEALLEERKTPAHRLKEVFSQELSIEKTLKKTYRNLRSS